MAYTVIATWVARQGEEAKVEHAIRKMIAPTRAEPRCLLYLAHRSPTDDRTFILVEQYEDEAAYTAHTESEHFREFAVGEGIPLLERRDRIFGVPLDE